MMRIPFVEICCNFVRWHRLSLYLYHLVADRCYDVEQSQFWLYHILTFAWKRKFRSKSINGFYHENMMRQVKMVAVVRISFNTYTHKISMHEFKSAPMCIPMSFFLTETHGDVAIWNKTKRNRKRVYFRCQNLFFLYISLSQFPLKC